MFSTLKMSSTQKIVMVFLHLKILSTWRIYTSVQVFSNFFIEELIPLCELTKIVFSILENGVNLKNICFCLSVFKPKMFFYLKNIHLCTSWLKWCILHWKIFKTSVIYIYHSAIIHLCDFSTWNIYISVRLYNSVIFLHLKYIHLHMIIHLRYSFYLKYIYLCEVIHLCDFFHLKYIISVQLCKSVIFYLKYTHFCAIIHLCDFFTWSIYTSVRLQTSVIFLNFP